MKMTNKVNYDKNRDEKRLQLKVNDLVIILKAKKAFKFEEAYEGPYRVEKILSPVSILVRKETRSMKVHIDRVKLAKADYGNKVPPKI